jgi:hypothetical protein
MKDGMLRRGTTLAEPRRPLRRPSAVRTSPLLLVAAMAGFVVAACSGAAIPPPSLGGSPSPSVAPTATPPPGIGHRTGAADIVLRFEEGGGFVPIWFFATQAPAFTLYGDGTVIFQDSNPEPLPTGPDGVTPLRPWRTARLSEEQIQELLAFAIVPGGLGVARSGLYENPMVMDAGTASFEIHVEGLDKRVDVYALGLEAEGVPDQLARRAFMTLADRLRDFDRGGSIPTDVYTPEAYRGVLGDSGPAVGNARAWPWPTIKPADFAAPADPNVPSLPRRLMTLDEVAVLGFTEPTGGFSGLTLQGSGDGALYTFSLRPLLPDEPA